MLLLLSVAFLFPQKQSSDVIDAGSMLSLHSNILNEDRTVSISLPRSYLRATVKYPVIYVLDGNSLFQITVAAGNFIAYNSSVGQMPEAIVVGIVNTNRDRDMPVPQRFFKTGGAHDFLAFLSKELVPFINAKYPVNGLNILIGHSQGALFATFAGVEESKLFKGIIALDAPVTVIEDVKRSLQQAMIEHPPQKYYSAESLYGWGKESNGLFERPGFKQATIEGESHETMPYKGIYDGLRYLFQDHLSAQNDLTVKNVQEYYKKLSAQWSCDYAVPEKVLLNQAIPMMVGRSKKAESRELIEYYERLYGANAASRGMTTKVNSLTSGPDERVDYYLNLPAPSEESVKTYLGKWAGTLIVPGGMDTDIQWEIKKVNGQYVLVMNVMNSFILRNDFLQVRGKNELVWGRKHQSGAIYLSIATLSADGQVLEGTEDLIGHHRAVGEPPFVQNKFRFTRVN